MGTCRLISLIALTISVTVFAQTAKLVSEPVQMAFSKTRGLWAQATGHAVISRNGSGRRLDFIVQGQVSDSVALADTDIRAVRAFNFTDYGARAEAEYRRGGGDRRVPAIFYYKPVVLVQYKSQVQIYAVDMGGNFIFLSERPAETSALVRAIVKDPSGISNGIDLDLLKLGSGTGAVYYSPELKAFVDSKDVLKQKEARDFGDLSTAQLLQLRQRNATAADEFEQAGEDLRNTKYLYVSEQEKQNAIVSFERAIAHSDPTDALLQRRILERSRAMKGSVLSAADVRNRRENAMSRYSEALGAALRELTSRSSSDTSACDRRLNPRH